MLRSTALPLCLLAALGCVQSKAPGAAEDAASHDAVGALPPLKLGVMVHLETAAAWENPAVYERYIDQLRDAYLPLLVAHGAKFTWQLRGELTLKIVERGDTILDDLVAAGQGLGVHADKGFPAPASQAVFVAQLTALRDQLLAVQPGFRNVSGICSESDWVSAAADAGFAFASGSVGYCAMSLPLADRPPEYSACESPAACHGTLPEAVEERIHPWRAVDGSNWLTDAPAGRLVMLAASVGLTCAAENEGGSSETGCMHAADDLAPYFADLDAAVAVRDAARVNLYYSGWSYGGPLNLAVTEEWLTRLDAYVADGRVEWATMDDMGAAFEAWEARP